MRRVVATQVLILPLDAGSWPPPAAAIDIDGLRLAPKPELHITLVGTALGAELQATFGSRANAITRGIHDAQDWHFERSGERLLLRKAFVEDGRAVVAHSVIERIELPAMARFHRALGRLLGRQLPVPPPHVTLYTAGRASGIGVSSAARLRAFTVRTLAAHESGR